MQEKSCPVCASLEKTPNSQGSSSISMCPPLFVSQRPLRAILK
jgi:hypothetical protein